MPRCHRLVELEAWLPGPLDADVSSSLERLARTDDVAHIAVMPDVHLCEDVCIGAVVATRSRLYPRAVGGDIGCGMAALRFECSASVLADRGDAQRLLRGLSVMVPANRHSRLTLSESLPVALAESPLSDPVLEKLKRRGGLVQFGTLGRGNHFLELQADEDDRLWVMVHSGSRAVGQAITDFHLRRAAPSNTGLAFLDAGSAAGQAYLSDVQWACRYAELSRGAMVASVEALAEEIFGVVADASSWISCHHNHVRRERHHGEDLWVHRKGALSAAEGEPGIIPGSMGTSSFHVTGRGCHRALRSSSHGAGRAMSRVRARREIHSSDLERQMRGVWFDGRNASSLLEEAPSAYKDIGVVMRAQKELTRIIRRLRPILSYKGGR